MCIGRRQLFASNTGIQMKKPALHGFSLNHWRVWTPCGKVTSSKRLRRDDSSLYTLLAENRKLTALVSFQSHFQGRCKQDYVTWGNGSCAMREQSAHPNYDTGIIHLTDKVKRQLVKLCPDTDWNEARGKPWQSRYRSLPLL